jgi:hypothetical protein
MEECMARTGLSLVECAMSLGRLEATGWVRQVDGWFERSTSWIDSL